MKYSASSPSNHSQTTRFDGLSLADRNPDFIQQMLPIWDLLYRYYFRVQSDGWHHVPASGKMLVVGSHNGGLVAPDMFMFLYEWFHRYGTERLAYGLMHPTVWQVSPDIAGMAVRCGAIKAHPKMAIAALRKNAPVLVYPGGAEDTFRPHHLRDKIYFAGRKGFIKLALREEVPIVPIISHGAHDTLMVLGDFYKEAKQLHELGMPWLFGIDPVVFPVYLGLPWGLGIGPLPHLPLPMQIRTRVCKPIVFEKYGKEAAGDRDYVDACFDLVTNQMQAQLDDLIGS